MVEKSDKFDERMLNRQNFPYQNFAHRKFLMAIAYFTNLSCYVRTWNYEIILDKKYPPKDKELPDPSGPLSKV